MPNIELMAEIEKDFEIKAELARKGISQREIALMLKVSPVSVNNVISGKRKTPRIRKAIALAIGKPVSEITWPEPS